MSNRFVQHTETERGNALFLILIAVVLFAALSFAITQSNRSTGSSAGEETNTISGSNITQYASAVRTGITRMLVRGTVLEDITFDQPGAANYTVNPPRQVFHPQGGAVVFQAPDANIVETGGQWYFFFANVKDMATTGLDAVAVLTKVKKGVCQQINKNIFGSTTVPALGTAITNATIIAATYNSASPVANTFDFGSTPNKPYGCFSSDGGAQFNYMHVLAEQ